MSVLSAARKLIEREITWCEEHPMQSDKGRDFEAGFVAGLTQARNLIAVGEILESDNAASAQTTFGGMAGGYNAREAQTNALGKMGL